ncbi:hypothetical protein RFI_14877, partial [Reticulomyxa filosa]
VSDNESENEEHGQTNKNDGSLTSKKEKHSWNQKLLVAIQPKTYVGKRKSKRLAHKEEKGKPKGRTATTTTMTTTTMMTTTATATATATTTTTPPPPVPMMTTTTTTTTTTMTRRNSFSEKQPKKRDYANMNQDLDGNGAGPSSLLSSSRMISKKRKVVKRERETTAMSLPPLSQSFSPLPRTSKGQLFPTLSLPLLTTSLSPLTHTHSVANLDSEDTDTNVSVPAIHSPDVVDAAVPNENALETPW